MLNRNKNRKSCLAHWRDDIQCVFQRDPAARNSVEVILTYPGVQAVMVHRVSHSLWQRGWRFFPRLMSFIARLLSNVDIHPGAQIGQRFFIDHGACVVIGETAEIGDDVTFYHGVTLGGTSWSKGRRHPKIGDGVMVGAGAKVLGAIEIGKNVRVGANSVVVEPVPDNVTVVGIPGKVVNVREAGMPNPFGIDLDHHLIPDPVGKAISCLMSRIDTLEQKLQQTGVVSEHYQNTIFQNCEVDNEICENDCSGGKQAIKAVN